MKNTFLMFLFLWTINPIPDTLKAQVWDSLGTDLRGNCRFHAIHNGKLIVSIKDSIDNMYLSNIGEWDGTSWDTLGKGTDGGIVSSTEFNGNLYVGGSFQHVNGMNAPPDPNAYNLAYWDGNYWQLTDYSNGANSGAWVNALEVYNNELYIGARGPITINGTIYNSIVRYDGTTWNDVGGGVLASFKEILCMTHFNGELIVAGRFDLAGTTQAYNIARWDGTQWHTMGDGLSYYVRALYVDTLSNELYAGGSFTQSGSTQLNFIAKWDGNAWQPLDNGLNGAVYGISFYKGGLFAGTSPYYNPSAIMRFDGNSWTPVFPSPNKLTYCLNVYQDALYASGSFDSIGGVPYAGIARYRDTITSLQPNLLVEKLFEIFPNPTNSKLEIIVSAKLKGTFDIIITDVSGKTVMQNEYLFNPTNIIFNLPEDLNNGLFTCHLRSLDYNYSENFIIHH